MIVKAVKPIPWVLIATALLAMALLCWSMALERGHMPPMLFWVPLGLVGLGLGQLLWRLPQQYAVLATSMLLGLPMTGHWESVGRWAATALMGLAGLRFMAMGFREGWQVHPRFQWPLMLVGALLGWGIVAAAGSPEPMRSTIVATQLATTVGGALACGYWIHRSTSRAWQWALMAATGLAVLLVRNLLLFSTLAKAAPEPYWLDSNYFSAAIALLLPLLLWILLTKTGLASTWKTQVRIASGVLLCFLLLGIAWLDSRGAWMSLAVVGGLVPVFVLRKMKARLFWLLGVAAMGLLLLFALPHAAERPRTHEPLDRVQSITDLQDFSNRERILRWTCAWRMAVEKPVLGHGPGRFAPLFKNFLRDGTEIAQISWWFGWRFGAHSDSLNILAETGFPGFLLFLGMLVAWFWAIWRRNARPPQRPGIRIAFIAAMATWLIHGLFNDLLSNPCIAAWVFALAGMLVADDAESRAADGLRGNEPAVG